RRGQFLHLFLNAHEPPELARKEVIHIAPALVVEALLADRRSPLEWILTEVHHSRHVRRHLRARPTLRLLEELELEVADANGSQVRATEVEEFLSRRRRLAQQQIELVVAVQMILVGPATQVRTFKKLVGDVGIAGGGHERGKPIQGGEDAVLDRARLDLVRPADDSRGAKAAFHHRTLGALERGHATIGPGEYLCAVVGREYDDSVILLAHVLYVLHYGADAVVELRHAGFFQTVVASAVHQRLVLGRQERPDVHARRVGPAQERL